MYKSILFVFLLVSILNIKIIINEEDKIINETERNSIKNDTDDQKDYRTVKIVRKEDKIINENDKNKNKNDNDHAGKEEIYGDKRILDDSRGFGDDIKWVKLDSALKINNKHGLPIFLVIHKSWCGACQSKLFIFSF
jgi:hypothetical protein